VSLTLSPLHLLAGPVLELAAEFRVGPGFGLALLGGFGEWPVEDSNGDEIRTAVYEIGAQAAWYPFEAFAGFLVGAELAYMHLETETLPDSDVSVVAGGLGLGPMAGYKLVTRGGFTFVVHAGVAYMAISAAAEEGERVVDEDERSRFVPLLNLNLGWSF
jgi:hypothetical protein